jgi:hypothetical protein
LLFTTNKNLEDEDLERLLFAVRKK